MNKLVNGTIVEIDNINLFEKANEDIVRDRCVKSIVPSANLDLSDSETELMNNCIELYKKFYTSLPYPLYALDCNTKYCSAGLYIQKQIEEAPRMYVDDALYIELNEESHTFLTFINYYWGITQGSEYKDNTLDLNLYSNDVGYEDISWAYNHIVNGEGTAKYYNEFMPKFIDACNKQIMVLKWELSNILTFYDVPNKITLPLNKIVHIGTDTEYTMDIYVSGRRPTGQKQMSISTVKGHKDELDEKPVYRTVYGYDLYSKLANVDINKFMPGRDKMKPVDIYGINSLFCTLCSIKNAKESDTFDDYRAVIYRNHLVFEIDGRLFVARSDKYVDAVEIARGVSIQSIRGNSLYFTKSKNIIGGIRKESIYCYSLNEDNLKLCKIQFVRV